MNLPGNLSPKKLVLSCLIGLMASSLTSLVMAADLVGDANKGASKVSLCAGCHAIPGYRSSVPEIYTIPMIGGQSAAYLVSALQAYKKGERKHPTMRGIAGSLSDQDMVDIAAYYAGQSASSKPNYLK
ncbi:MAG: cytochrome c [Betaproteobacteria bacterium]|jgi:cytochrome c553|nr:cytochrome c [Polynucleobacter sp.]NBY65134.1 cytochrome c [Betaproteobacteria bacterium]